MFFQNKKVLVAGGTGLIGIPLVEMLIEQGASVRIASMDDPVRSHPDAEFVQADLLKFDNCLKVCEGTDYVFNLLGVKGFPGLNRTKPASFMYPTVTMSFNMLEASRRAGVSGYIFTSSLAVYASAEIFCEDDVWQTFPAQNDWYAGWSKRICELQTEAYKLEYGWDKIAVVRPANVYGPFDNFKGHNAMVIPSLIRKVLSEEKTITLWGDGSSVRDFIHTRDVARGILLVAEKMPDKPVNLGSGVGISIKKLLNIILSNSDRNPEIIWDTSKPSGDKYRILDTSRAMLLGFQPVISIEEGIRQVTEWYRKNVDKNDGRYDVFNTTVE